VALKRGADRVPYRRFGPRTHDDDMTVLPEPNVHRFTPDEVPRRWEIIEPLAEALDAMPVGDEDELRAFLVAWNEFHCWVTDHVIRVQTRTRTHTTDEAAREQFNYLNAEVLPRLTTWGDRLGRKMLASPAIDRLEETAYAPFVRQVRRDVELYREENLELERQINELTNRYNEISGG